MQSPGQVVSDSFDSHVPLPQMALEVQSAAHVVGSLPSHLPLPHTSFEGCGMPQSAVHDPISLAAQTASPQVGFWGAGPSSPPPSSEVAHATIDAHTKVSAVRALIVAASY
jgi:hypothetical protein